MQIDVVFPVFTDGAELEFLSALGARLRAEGRVVAFLSTSPIALRTLEAQGFLVEDIYAGLQRVRPSDDAMRSIERRYGLPSLRSFVYPEYTYDWARSYDEILACAAQTFTVLERFCETHQVRSFFNNLGGETVRRCIGAFCRKNGITNLIADFSPFPGRSAFAESEMGVVIPPIDGELTDEELATAREFIATMLARRKPYLATSKLGFGLENFRGALRLLSSIRQRPDVSASKLIDQRLRRVVRRVVGNTLYQTRLPEAPFVFFPLHLANDSVITVRAPQFQRQDDLVAFIAERALPTGVELCVKPHIAARDAYPVDMMTRIARLPNVRLLDPTLNPHDLIDRAEVTLVINSTTGFEGIVHRRPVVVLGNPFYRGHGLTTDVSELRELPFAIEQARGRAPDPERVVRFVAQCWRLSFEGIHSDANPTNVAAVCRAVARKLDEHAS